MGCEEIFEDWTTAADLTQRGKQICDTLYGADDGGSSLERTGALITRQIREISNMMCFPFPKTPSGWGRARVHLTITSESSFVLSLVSPL